METDDGTPVQETMPWTPGLTRRRLPLRRMLIVAIIAVAVVAAGFTVMGNQTAAVPGEDFTAWTEQQVVALARSSCPEVPGCDAPELDVTPGTRVRLGFRSGNPLSLTTDQDAGVFVALDDEGWYLDTTTATGTHVVGLVGGDGNLWQFVLRMRT